MSLQQAMQKFQIGGTSLDPDFANKRAGEADE